MTTADPQSSTHCQWPVLKRNKGIKIFKKKIRKEKEKKDVPRRLGRRHVLFVPMEGGGVNLKKRGGGGVLEISSRVDKAL